MGHSPSWDMALRGTHITRAPCRTRAVTAPRGTRPLVDTLGRGPHRTRPLMGHGPHGMWPLVDVAVVGHTSWGTHICGKQVPLVLSVGFDRDAAHGSFIGAPQLCSSHLKGNALLQGTPFCSALMRNAAVHDGRGRGSLQQTKALVGFAHLDRLARQGCGGQDWFETVSEKSQRCEALQEVTQQGMGGFRNENQVRAGGRLQRRCSDRGRVYKSSGAPIARKDKKQQKRSEGERVRLHDDANRGSLTAQAHRARLYFYR